MDAGDFRPFFHMTRREVTFPISAEAELTITLSCEQRCLGQFTRRPLWVISGRSSQHPSTSALPPQADIQFDTNCDGKADRSLFIPDNKSEPISALIDSNFELLRL
jgi:hypothetical protein